MAVLRPVVEVATDLLVVAIFYVFYGGSIRAKSVSHDGSRRAVSFHRFLQERKCSLLIPGFCHVAFQHLTFVVDGAPQVMLYAVDLHEDLIEMPLPLRMLPHKARAFRPDLAGEDWTKKIDSEPYVLMANIDAALMKKVFNVAK